VLGLVGQRQRGAAARQARTSVAQACAVLASHLRVGQVASEALTLAAADCPVLREVHRVAAIGGDVTRTWRTQATAEGHEGLLDLARAWHVSSETGAPMSATLEQVAASLAADQALRTVVSSELAAPRATSKVMAALPALGIGLGYLLGGEPLRWLVAGPFGWVCLLGGVGLACLGVLWIETLARQASS
jgi:tight adherence protein B